MDTNDPIKTAALARKLDIDDIKMTNKSAGKFWFSPDTMRFFHSRVYAEVFQSQNQATPYLHYFISSECREPGETPRLYTVRVFDARTASINDVGGFQAHDTRAKAIKAARAAAAAN